MRRSLASAGRFETVKTTVGSETDHWKLKLEVQQFYGILDAANGTSSVKVRFEGNLQCHGQEHHLQLDASKPVHENRLAVVVSAHQQALDDTSRQLVEQVIDYCK
jgi:ABC-type uncharacterized transport system auxiliary subunit